MEYTINGKTYTQEKLVLGQWAPLVELLKDKEITDLSAFAILKVLGDAGPRCMAIILVPKGESVKGRDIDALEDEFTYNTDMDVAMKVVSDFFLCNQPSSLSKSMRQMMAGISEKMAEMTTS